MVAQKLIFIYGDTNEAEASVWKKNWFPLWFCIGLRQPPNKEWCLLDVILKSTALHIFHFCLPIALLCWILLYCLLVCIAVSSCCHLSYMWILNPMRQNCLSGCRVLSVMNPQPISESLRCQSNVNTNRKMKHNGSVFQSLLDSIVTLQYFALCRKYKISDKQGTPQARWKRLCDLGNNRHWFLYFLSQLPWVRDSGRFRVSMHGLLEGKGANV